MKERKRLHSGIQARSSAVMRTARSFSCCKSLQNWVSQTTPCKSGADGRKSGARWPLLATARLLCLGVQGEPTLYILR